MTNRRSKGDRGGLLTLRTGGWIAGLLGVTALALWGMGRVWWCSCGQPDLSSWDVWTRHNSQHLIDPYTLSHVLHGIIFYGLFRVLPGERGRRGRFVMAVAIESLWEILENTPMMIERYREATISLDYFGDSIINSLADVLACVAGYLLAGSIPVRWSISTLVMSELVMLVWIRDSLALNILMLVWPIEAIRNWQMAF